MRKIIVVLLVFLSITGMLAASGAKESAKPAATEKVRDLGGREIVYVAWWDNAPTDDAVIAKRAALQEKYNFKLTYVNGGEWQAHHDSLIASILAGDPVGDFVFISQNFFAGLVAKKLIQAVDGHGIDFSADYYHQLKRAAFSYDGHEYGIKEFYVDPATGWWFNKTMLQKEGVEDIYALQREGKWNWDKMLEIAKKVTKDLDGDGTIDQWGFIEDVQHMLAMALVAGNGGNVVVDGKFVLDSPQAIEALQFYQDLNMKYKVVAMRPEGVEWNWAYHEFGAGKIAFLPHFYWLPESQMGDVQDELGWALFPAGPKGGVTSAYFPNETVVIPAGVVNIDDLLFIWDLMVKPDPDFDDLDADPYNYLYDRFFDIESVEETQYMINSGGKFTPFVHEMFNLKADWEAIPGPILRGEKSPNAAVQEVKPAIEAKIADAYKS